MIKRTEPSEPEFLSDVFAQALRGEPALGLDLAAIEHRGRRRLAHRRLAVMAGAGLAVVTLSAGIAFGAADLAGSTDQVPMAAVPGCTTVLRTTDPVMLSWMYDGQIPTPTPMSGVGSTVAEPRPVDGSTAPETPAWFTPRKASTMRAALAAALPAGVTLQPAGDGTSLPFTDQPGGGGFVGSTRAELSIQAQQLDRGAPPCTEVLSLRYVAPDGTVADVITSGTPGERQQLTAEAFHPDGTLVSARLGWEPSASTSSASFGRLPLTERDLAILVADPAFAIH